MNRHVAFSNTVALFILTIGLASAWLVRSELEFRNRLVSYAYVDVLLSIAKARDMGTLKLMPLSPLERCQLFEQSQGCDGTNDTEPTEEAPLDNDAYSQVLSKTPVLPRSWGDSLNEEAIILPVPMHNPSAREYVDAVIGLNHPVLDIIYVEFPNQGIGWPAFLVKRQMDEGIEWNFVLISWSSLWFLKTEWSMSTNPTPELDWAQSLPSPVVSRLLGFQFTKKLVSEKDVRKQILRDARSLTGRTFGSHEVDEAISVLLSEPEIEVGVPNLPQSRLVILSLLPFVFAYCAILLWRSTAVWTSVKTLPRDPWLLLNARHPSEIAIAMFMLTLMIATSIAVVWMVIVTEDQLWYLYNMQAAIFLDGELFLYDTSENSMQAYWISEGYNDARMSGTPYLDRIAYWGLAKLAAAVVGLLAVLAAVRNVYLHISQKVTWLGNLNERFDSRVQSLASASASVITPVLKAIGSASARIVSSRYALRSWRLLWATLAAVFGTLLVAGLLTAIRSPDYYWWLGVLYPDPSFVDHIGPVTGACHQLASLFELGAMLGLACSRQFGPRWIWILAGLFAALATRAVMNETPGFADAQSRLLIATLLNSDAAVMNLATWTRHANQLSTILMLMGLSAAILYPVLYRTAWIDRRRPPRRPRRQSQWS